MTLVEIMITLLVMAMIMAASITAIQRASQATAAIGTVSRLNQRASRCLQELAETLVHSGSATLAAVPTAPLGADELTFQNAVSFSGDAITWGDIIRLSREPDPNDPVNGLDDDGDGLIDEGFVVRTTRPGMVGEVIEVLATDVPLLLEGEEANGLDDNGNGLIDEPGLVFDLEGLEVNIRLTLMAPGPNGGLVTRTLETKIAQRN